MLLKFQMFHDMANNDMFHMILQVAEIREPAMPIVFWITFLSFLKMGVTSTSFQSFGKIALLNDC